MTYFYAAFFSWWGGAENSGNEAEFLSLKDESLFLG